ncbi:class I SAM-dependent methyltransferase [Rugosimonospora acidiphila]|uniref:Class I SAM-dependent methyltransferase n=1 Tax=Rugosimonospora acidiphila TaxID=556531 RepID=A0ABP9STQ6_9ACTN
MSHIGDSDAGDSDTQDSDTQDSDTGDSDREDAVWDAQAAVFDEEPDHGLTDPAVRDAWSALLASVLPAAPASVVDIGCGTGSLAVLLGGAGHRVVGLDASAGMLEVARGKATRHGVTVPLVRADASMPPLQPGSFDVVLVRHLLWAVRAPEAVLARWIGLLAPRGRLVLIEGRWATGAGLSAAECVSLVRRHGREVELRLLDDDTLWGKTITDQRYLLLSR